MQDDLVLHEPRPLTAVEMKAQVQTIQQVMASVMVKDVHYGIIPGCGNKSALYKPGAEKLMMTFRLAADPQVVEVPTEDGITFRVFCRITNQATGIFLGNGIGECSSKEEKYNWRATVSEKEWANTAEDRKRIKYARNGEIYQIRTNPADVANTVLKMAKKRALVDAILTVTAASDIFEQDLEDMDPNLVQRENGAEKKQPPKQPQSKSQGSADKQAQGSASEYVIATVESVTTKKGNKNGKDWQAWTINAGGEKYGTFSESLANVAVAGETVKIGFTVGKFGKEIVSIEVCEEAPVKVPEGCPKDLTVCGSAESDENMKTICGVNNGEPCPFATA